MIPVSWSYQGELDDIAVEDGPFVCDGWPLVARTDWVGIAMNGDDIPITVRMRGTLRSASG
jgi:hypothetical protein